MKLKNILITGGAGYVGAVLVPRLLSEGYQVKVLDLMIYGENVLDVHPNLTTIKGDIRNQVLLKKTLKDVDIVIHLACISNDPSFELNPKLGRSINYEAFEPLVGLSRNAGVKRFVYASSSSVYGVKTEENVFEDMKLEPLTDYSLFKAKCEEILNQYTSDNFTTVILRPATVCGFSRRQRLDVVVNILTNLAYHKKVITVLGGNQLRPNIHVDDMVRAYSEIIKAKPNMINGEAFNVGYENISVDNLARQVKDLIGGDIKIVYKATNDNRSYHISSTKIEQTIRFSPRKTVEDAIVDLKKAFDEKILQRPLDNEFYFNIKRMKSVDLE